MATGGGGTPAIAASCEGLRKSGWVEGLPLLASSGVQVAEGWEQVQTAAAALEFVPNPSGS